MTPRARPRLCLELPALDPREERDSVRRTNALVRSLCEARYDCAAREDADLVVAGGLFPGRVEGPPRWVLPHGALGDPAHWLLTLPELRGCDVLALASRSDAAVIARMAGTPFCTCVELPLFVDTEFFAPDPAQRDRTRRAHGLDASLPLLLTVSSLDVQKNVADAIRLCHALRHAGAGVALAIVGEGRAAERGALEVLVGELGLGDAVRFLGAQAPSAVRDLYGAADLFVHLTLQRKESFGLAPVEAQACGLPVLASAWGGVRDTVLEGETGHYAPVTLDATGRHVAWSAVVAPARTLLADSARRARFGERARAWAVERFSLEAFARGFDEALAEWWADGTTRGDLRRVALARAADPLLVAFAAIAARHPGEDSRAVSDRVMQSEAGARAQQVIFECMIDPQVNT